MKVAVSLPDDVYRDADRVAVQLGLKRSQLYARAIEEFLAARREDEVTARLGELAGENQGGGGAVAARSLIDAGRWEW